MLLSLCFNCLECRLDCELSFNGHLITLWQPSEFSSSTTAMARVSEGSLVSWLQEGPAGFEYSDVNEENQWLLTSKEYMLLAMSPVSSISQGN